MDISEYIVEKDPQDVASEKTETAINHIVTPHKEDEKIFWKKFAEIFDRQKVYPAQREKTEDEDAVVKHILSKMKEFVEGYGGVHVNYQKKHLHVADQKKFSRDDWVLIRSRGLLDGEYFSVLQSAVINLYKNDDLICFANVTAHELLHGHAFQSVRVVWADDDKKVMRIFDRQSGLTMCDSLHKDKSVYYLHWLDEAITQELTERFSLTYLMDLDIFEDRMWLREYFLPNVEKNELFLYGYCRDKIVKGYSITRYGTAEAYPKERKIFNTILNDIVEKMGDRFPTTEDIFRLFAHAYFTGHLLPVVRVIETVYGKGSFRDMAMCEKKIIDLQSYDLALDF